MPSSEVGAYHWDQDGVLPGGMTLVVDIIPHVNIVLHMHNVMVTSLDHQECVYHVDDIVTVHV